ncbi:MAG: tryptophan synthase subunit alpha [Lachnospiraceae bacterium]|nr:tryptophan synthase subunit alpha [Lachnospiraceae bacterium]
MSKIQAVFEKGKAFIPFITCGDPDLETTKKLVISMAENGADIIELGIPFSDPTAEGPVIQGANIRALSHGVTTDQVFGMVKELRACIETPLVFMTYANVVFSYGTERFVRQMAECGMDGLILPDVPFEEKHEFLDVCDLYGIDFISLVAPTSENRMIKIAKEARGFLYVVSSLGVTGTRSEIKTDLQGMINTIKSANPDLPCAIGFGISTPEQVEKMSRIADGAIVGSAIVKLIGKYGTESVGPVSDFVKDMKAAQSV